MLLWNFICRDDLLICITWEVDGSACSRYGIIFIEVFFISVILVFLFSPFLLDIYGSVWSFILSQRAVSPNNKPSN